MQIKEEACELRFIVAVAQKHNFRRAAEKSFISQPVLSLAVQKLEEELGLKIFERGKGEVAPTPAGSAIIEQAQRVLEEAERIREIAAVGKNQLAAPLHIGVIHSVGPYLLPDLIPALKKVAPRMPLQVEENLTANLEEMLRCGKLDVIIIALPFGDNGILTRALYDEPFEVVVPSAHPLAKRRERGLPRVAPQGGKRPARHLTGDHPQHGGLRPWHHRAACLGQQRPLSQQVVERDSLRQSIPGAAHRAGLAQELSAWRGD